MPETFCGRSYISLLFFISDDHKANGVTTAAGKRDKEHVCVSPPPRVRENNQKRLWWIYFWLIPFWWDKTRVSWCHFSPLGVKRKNNSVKCAKQSGRIIFHRLHWVINHFLLFMGTVFCSIVFQLSCRLLTSDLVVNCSVTLLCTRLHGPTAIIPPAALCPRSQSEGGTERDTWWL